jgi:hypothetical protein
MVLLDDSRVVVDANGALLKLVGHDRGVVVGMPGYRLVRDGPLLSNRELSGETGGRRRVQAPQA